MKRFLCSLLVFAATTAFSQAPAPKQEPKPKKTAEQRATDFSNRMEKNLSLTADQKTKVHDLALTKEQKMDQLREQCKDKDPGACQPERKKIHQDFNSGMKTVLTVEQWERWEAIKKAKRQQHRRQQHQHQKPQDAPKEGK